MMLLDMACATIWAIAQQSLVEVQWAGWTARSHS
jgi:hypothetical protein